MSKKGKLALLAGCFVVLVAAGVSAALLLNRPKPAASAAPSSVSNAAESGVTASPTAGNASAYTEQTPIPFSSDLRSPTRMGGFVLVDGQPAIAHFSFPQGVDPETTDLRQLEFLDPADGAPLYQPALQLAYADVNRIALDGDKNVWIAGYDAATRQMSVQAYDAQGNVVQDKTVLQGLLMDPEQEHPEWSAIEKMAADSDRIYVLNVSNNTDYMLQIFDHTGAKVESLPGVMDFDVDQQGHLYLFYDKNQTANDSRDGGANSMLQKRNVLDGAELWSAPLKGNEGYDSIRYCPAEACVVALGRETVDGFYETPDGCDPKKLLTVGVDTSFTALDLQGQYFPLDAALKPDGTLYLLLQKLAPDGQSVPSNVLYIYKLGGGSGKAADTVLKITAPYPDEYLLEATTRYQKSNPDVRLELDTVYPSREEFRKNAEQYGQQLTLRILSNDVGDIVMTGGSGLDTENVLHTDAFLDLSDRIAKEPAAREWNSEVLDAMRIGGAVRGLPMGVYYQYLDVNLTLQKKLGLDFDPAQLKWSDVLRIAREVEQKDPGATVFAGPHDIAVSSCFYAFLLANSADLVDTETQTADLNQPWFTQLLSEWDYQKTQPGFGEDIPADLPPDTPIFFGNTDLHDNTLFALGSDTQRFFAPSLETYLFYSWEDHYGTQYQHVQVPIPMGEKQPNRLAYTRSVYSISANTKNPDAAWDFLRFMLSAPVQASASLPGRPVNQKATQDLFDAGKRMHPETKEQMDAYFRMMQPVFTQVNTLFEPFLFGQDMMPLTNYMGGVSKNQTLEDALAQSQKNLTLRVNE